MRGYRKHYNPIYRLWELQREQPSGLIEGSTTWAVIAMRETEAEIDSEPERAEQPPLIVR